MIFTIIFTTIFITGINYFAGGTTNRFDSNTRIILSTIKIIVRFVGIIDLIGGIMVADKNACTSLISDVVFLTQRASANTCDVAARTIERLVSRHLSEYPGDIKNAGAYEITAEKLCESVRSLAHVAGGTGEEILVKRRALDLLLALSNEIEYLPNYGSGENLDIAVDIARTA